jgi:HK97 family phage prohead protease
MKLTVPITLTATNSEKRTISGRVLTWGEQGNTSAGLTSFIQDSIKPKAVKLNLEHDVTRPIGRVVEMVSTPEGLDATFKIAETTAGTDALIEAASGLRDGFSVGVKVDEWSNEDGVLVIKQGEMAEVSLVTNPAIKSAMVSDVAATENSESESKESEAENPTTTKPEGDEVETTPTVPEASAETVEAASQNVQATTRPVFFTKPRSPIVNMGSWVEHSIKAQLNPNSDSALYVKAATDDLGSTNPAFNPTRQLNEVINGLSNATRGNIDAISRGALPDAGLSFEIPKITAVATVAAVAESGAVSNTGVTSSFLTVSISRYAGRNILTTEIIERSSPDFFNELISIMGSAMALAQTKAVGTALLAGATQDVTPTANTAAGLLGFTSRSNSAIYASTQRFARSLIVSPDQWSNIMSYNNSGQPLFNAYQPQNQTGLVTGQSQIGVVAGLNFYVDNSGVITGTGDDSMVVVEPNSYTWYESPNYRLDVNKPSDGTVEISINSYGAIATKIGAGARKFNFT